MASPVLHAWWESSLACVGILVLALALSMQQAPLQLAASGGTWLWGDAGTGPPQALALACLSPWILLTLLELHFQVPSGLVNFLATHSISLSPSL